MKVTSYTNPRRARDECCNFRHDGTCLRIEPSSLRDYSMGLPDWITEQQWDALVAGAIVRGETTIGADRRTGGLLDAAGPHANRHRLDLYYCPECGRRMGHAGDVCLWCGNIKWNPEDVDRRCVVARGTRCRYFEKSVLGMKHKPKPRPCPECGVELPPRQRFCAACAKAHKRDSQKASRSKRVTQQLSENHAHKSLLAKG